MSISDKAKGISDKAKETLAYGKDTLAYGKDLVESGIEGAKEASRTVLEAPETSDMLTEAARDAWQPATIGVLAGAICGVLADDRKPIRGVVAGGLLGAVLGFAGGFAWKTRPLTAAMSRGAGKNIERVRDGHWLSKHPINYG
ncbi:hypothetical protein [Propionivibrio soli]|uniref:hypothetical protein n=1 Tax=Propionivibrio soli TaxID=2976531 RepID=UPI0021E7F371|nr:hypothetical protein [Propionivibrio soli]